MFDDFIEKDIDQNVKRGGNLNHRQFGQLVAVSSFATLLPAIANAKAVAHIKS